MVRRPRLGLTRDMTILVLGSTGKTGRRVVERLRAGGAPVRAASRSGEVHFDWQAPETWQAAVRGAEAIYLVAPEDPAPIANFVEQAVAGGVRRFAVLSGRGMDHTGGRFGVGMSVAEDTVRASGAEWTILRANNFNQNFSEDLWFEPLRDGRLGLPMGAVGEPFVDVIDIAEVAATVLTRDGHAGRIYELSGPRSITFAQAVAEISAASGHPVTYAELTPQEYAAERIAEGWPPELAAEMNVMFELMRAGHLTTVTDTVAQLLGRPATDFSAYVEQVWSAGVPVPA